MAPERMRINSLFFRKMRNEAANAMAARIMAMLLISFFCRTSKMSRDPSWRGLCESTERDR